METFKVNKKTFSLIENDNIEYTSTNILINWVGLPLHKSISNQSNRILLRSGLNVSKVFGFFENLIEGDSFSVLPGQLEVDLLLNGIISFNLKDYPRLIDNICKIITSYNDAGNNIYSVSVYFLRNDSKLIEEFINQISNLNVETILIYTLNENQYNFIKNILAHKRDKILLSNKLDNLLLKIGNLFSYDSTTKTN